MGQYPDEQVGADPADCADAAPSRQARRRTWRNIPLDRVAAALGYRKDAADRARFRRQGSVISINGEKFFDHLRGTGGGGAIDLVIHATGFASPDAVRFLAGHERRGRTAAVPATGRRLRLPRPSHRAWPRVRDALVRQRSLSADVLEACLSRGFLYADDRLNAVFVCRNANGNPPAPRSSAPRRTPAQGASGGWRPARARRVAASGSPATETGPHWSPSPRAPSMPDSLPQAIAHLSAGGDSPQPSTPSG